MVTLHKCCESRSLLLCSYDYRKEEKSKEKGGQGEGGQFLEFKFNRIVLPPSGREHAFFTCHLLHQAPQWPLIAGVETIRLGSGEISLWAAR